MLQSPRCAGCRMEGPSFSRTALLIEDDPEIRGIVTTLLTGEGFQVEEAGDGRTALERVFLIKPDLILVDLRLPGVGGEEICKRVRAGGLDTPIIVISAAKEEFDRVLLLELGADDFLVKPFGARELLARIRAVMRRSTRERAIRGFGSVDLAVTVLFLMALPLYDIVCNRRRIHRATGWGLAVGLLVHILTGTLAIGAAGQALIRALR